MIKWKIIILFVLGVTSVFPTLWATFVFDDAEAILKNEDVINPKSNFYNIFTNDYWGVKLSHNLSHKSYRPFTTFSFRWNYLMWGQDAFGAFAFHLVNVIVHGINCVLVYYFLQKCLNAQTPKYDAISYVAAIIFAVHPVHVEACGGLVGRADLLAACVFMGGFLLIPTTTERPFVSSLIITFISILGSLFKENAIVAVILYITLDIIIKRKYKLTKWQIFNHLISLGLVLSFVWWRLSFQGGAPQFQQFDNPPAFASKFFVRVTSILYVWMLNVYVLIHPIWLCYDWSMSCVSLIRSPLDIRFYYVIIFLGIGIRLAFVAMKSKVIMTALLIAATTFLPSSNLIFTVGFVLAERNLYLPSVGYALFLSCAFLRHGNVKFIIFTVMWLYIRSVQRSVQWIDEGLLFKSALQVCPANAKVHYNLGTFYGESGHKVLAADSYGTALSLKPDYYQAMNNLGNLLRSQEQYDEAEMWLRKAVDIKSDFAAAWMNLGIVLSRKNSTEALECYFRALEHRKRYPDCEYNLGNLYLDIGDKVQALNSWKKTVAQKPNHAQAWINGVILLDQEGKIEEAKDWALKGAEILTTDDTLQFLLGNVLGKLSDFEKAEKHFKRAIQLCQISGKKVPPKYYANLGVLYHRWDKKSLAILAYVEALKMDPNLESAQKNLANLKLATNTSD